jgi:hypothetical protein
MLKDYWGNEAIDYGPISQLWDKYSDKVFVSVTNKPFGDSYALFVCSPEDEYKAEVYMENYRANMKSKGITAFGIGLSLGSDLQAARMENFQGGAVL